MALLTDHQLGMAQESTYGTAVTVSRFLPMLPSTTHDVNLERVQSAGLIVGGLGYQRTARQAVGVPTYPLQIDIPAQSRGIGLPLSWCGGTTTHTLVSGTTYQSVITPARTTVTPPTSFTCQLGIVETVTAGTVDAYTYSGCVASALTITCPDDGEATISIKALAKTLATGTALATASYAAAPSLYHHDSGTATLGGTLTTPTATTLATVSTPTGLAVRSWQLEIDHGLVERPIVGGYQQPAWGSATAKLSTQIEYDGTWWRTAMLAGTALPFVGALTGGALSSGVETLQVVVPSAVIDPGVLPKPTAGEIVTVDVEWQGMYDGTSQPWYIVHRTADTAL